MPFPSNIPSYAGFTSSHTLQADNHAAQSNAEQADIIALATKLGVNNSLDVSSVDYKLTKAIGDIATNAATMNAHIANTSNPHNTTATQLGLGNVNNTSDATKQLAFLKAAFPVGCIYTETTGTNPVTTFGFGTWSAYGSGQVLIGINSSDPDFAAGGQTGGAKTVAGAAHTHPLSSNGQADMVSIGNTIYGNRVSVASYTYNQTILGSSGSNASGTIPGPDGVALAGATDSATPGATSVVQPYIVVYFWTRTA